MCNSIFKLLWVLKVSKADAKQNKRKKKLPHEFPLGPGFWALKGFIKMFCLCLAPGLRYVLPENQDQGLQIIHHTQSPCWTDLPPDIFIISPTSVTSFLTTTPSLTHYTPPSLSSLLFLGNSKITPTSGPLHLVLPMPGSLFFQKGWLDLSAHSTPTSSAQRLPWPFS